MIAFSNVTKQHGPQILFIDASFQVDPGEKVGLVGPNGSGKTTIFRLILGEEMPDDGRVERPKKLSVGCFRQDVGDMKGRTALLETVSAAGEVANLGQELATLERKLEDVEDPNYDKIIERFGEVQERFSSLGGYELEARAAAILAGLGLSDEQIHQDVGALSGGWKMRVALAQVLLAKPDVLLLDEPTNHLDIESILWLETFLREYKGTVIMTCHDKDVMNRVVKRIVEIDGGVVRSFSGDYDFYVAQRTVDAVRREAEYDKQQAMLQKELRFIERFRAQPRKASQVQSRAKKIDKIERVEPPKRLVERRFEFKKCTRSGDDVVNVAGAKKAYGNKVVHNGVSLQVRRGERWAVMGENGAGKTTLLRLIAGATEPDAGGVKIGAAVEMAYYAQHQMEQLDPDRTVIEELMNHAPAANLGTLRNLAGAFGFSGDDTDKPISVLSGGEKSRLVLAKIMYLAPNLMVLDEPTNHLDLDTKRALVKALSEYEGTLVFVSHDRAFLRAIANRVLELGKAGPHAYPGTYDEYVAKTGHEAPGMRV